MQNNINKPETDATAIFCMPSSDATVPDLMGGVRPSNPTLTILKGPQTGQTFELATPEITIGRDPSSDVFLNDMTVSRHHEDFDFWECCHRRRPWLSQRYVGRWRHCQQLRAC